MSKLFKRIIKVRTPTIEITNDPLHIEFEVPFDDDSTANVSTIRIYNINENTRARIGNGQILTLEAGYEGDVSVILKGEITHKYVDKVGTDRATILKVIDSHGVTNPKPVKKSYKKAVKSSTVIKDLAAAIGLNIKVLKLPNDKVHKKGYSVSNNALDNIRRLGEDCGASFYFSLGNLYIRDIREGDNTRVILTPENGLIGTPELTGRTYQKKYADCWRVTSLLNNKIATAAILSLDCPTVRGQFRVISGEHIATKHDFFTKFEVIK